jgi:diketogulonate reductase-like aldo/keto reductase
VKQKRHGVAVLACSPFGHNDFLSPRSREGQVLHGIADARRVTARQIALAFLTRPPAVFAIPKAAWHLSDLAMSGLSLQFAG